MSQRKRFLTLGLLILVLLGVDETTLLAATPMAQIKETIDRVVAILKIPVGAIRGDGSQIRDTLRNVLAPRFDFREMARMSLGSHWDRQPNRQEEFVLAFADFVESSYVAQIQSLREVKVIYFREQMDQQFAQVETRIVPGNGNDIPIDYKLHLVGSEWKIYDVLIEKISLVSNYRSQFNRILVVGSFDELLRRIRSKRADHSPSEGS